jgi:hypothetical protein
MQSRLFELTAAPGRFILAVLAAMKGATRQKPRKPDKQLWTFSPDSGISRRNSWWKPPRRLGAIAACLLISK